MSKDNSFDFRSKFEEWDLLKDSLVQLFKENDDSRKIIMEHGIQLLKDIIKVADGVNLINFTERFEFIQKNSSNYTAYRQLDELFKEAKKKIAVKRIMNDK
ncbi:MULTISPECIES: YpoC family protein [Bacillaceae]|uniref:YpoC family protein n=1 Tax=Bacillaceae TaxID=186817 RepID=UPI0006FC5B3C|nr:MULTISPECIES: hypothetical protein [Bacillaceae]MDF2067148.1 hypothetical protein [Bacillus sp. Cr_A10]